jgi:hypothetical protein
MSAGIMIFVLGELLADDDRVVVVDERDAVAACVTAVK